MRVRQNRRTVRLELPSGIVRRITLKTARMLLRERHAGFVTHSPMTIRLRLWALPLYRRFYRWSSSSEGAPGMGLFLQVPSKSKSKKLETDLPENWGITKAI